VKVSSVVGVLLVFSELIEALFALELSPRAQRESSAMIHACSSPAFLRVVKIC
jgi:hypothetical protein